MAAITASNLVKRFRHLGIPKHTTIKETVMKRLLGGTPEYREVCAIDGVSFSVGNGQVLGVIGRNGSGKTTLLRLLAGVYKLDGGEISISGSLAPLLALGAGFHPDLTGRESARIELLVLGFSPQQIEERMAAILDFAEIGDFIDAPIRTYSAGMIMRLAFAAAVSVNPDVLLLDEVLAVGDAAFAEKCLRCIDDFRKRGKTIVLVTHSSLLVRQLCDAALWLDRGKIAAYGDPVTVADSYDAAMTSAISSVARHTADVAELVPPPARRTLIVYGNCQAEALAKLMEKDQLINSLFQVLYYRSFEDPNQVRTLLSAEQLQNCALFYSQREPVPFPYADALPKDCVTVRFPSVDLNLLWPFNCINPYNYATPEYPFGPFVYGDRVILECVAKGQPAEKILEYYLSGWDDYKPNLSALARIEKARLESRDAHCDIAMGPWIMERFTQQRLFWTVNHPTQFVLEELLRRLFAASAQVEPALQNANIEETVRVYFPAGELLKIASIPIHPMVAAELGLEWYKPEERYNVFGRMYSYEEYLREMIAFCVREHAARSIAVSA